MENHTFNAPHKSTDSTAFEAPTGKLAEHLQNLAEVAQDARGRMDHNMQALMALTDKAALRAAEVQQKA